MSTDPRPCPGSCSAAEALLGSGDPCDDGWFGHGAGGPDGTARLTGLLRPLARRIVDAGAVPFPNAMALPRPVVRDAGAPAR